MAIITRFFGTTPAEPVMARGRRLYLVERCIDRTTKHPSLFENRSELLQMKKIVDISSLHRKHPFYVKLQEAITKCKGILPHEVMNSAISSNDDKKYDCSQGLLTTEEMIEKIEKEGSEYSSIEVNDLTDKLVAAILTHCTKLNYLKWVQREDCLDTLITDQGLADLAKIKTLTHLEFNAWAIPGITPAGLINMFSSPLFTQNLISLKVVNAFVADEVFGRICLYKNLQSLSIWSADITQKGFLANYLPATLTSLELHQKQEVPDYQVPSAFLNYVAKLPGLTKLSLEVTFCKFTVSNDFVNLLGNLPNLRSLSLSFPITSMIVAKLNQLFTVLKFENCSQLQSQDFSYIQSQKALVELHLGAANNLFGIAGFPQTIQKLHLDAQLVTDLDALSDSITDLTLVNMNQVPSDGYAPVFELPLKALQVQNCEHFNDESLKDLSKSKNRDQLEVLFLNHVWISDNGVQYINELIKLNSLAIANCNALTNKGLHDILSLFVVTSVITRLYFNNMPFSSSLANAVDPHKTLKVMYLGNPSLPYKKEGDIYKNKELKESNAIVVEWDGDNTNSYSEFLSQC